MPKIEATDVLVELAYTFGWEAGRCACRLSDGTAKEIRQVFSRTVEPALRDTPEAWTPEAHRYIVKQVTHIARDACRVAQLTSSGEITPTIFDEAARDVIAQEQQVCHRVKEMALKKSEWREGISFLGVFCKGL